MDFLLTTLFAFVFAAIGVPIFLGICRLFLVYTTVKECRCKVFVLFGKVIGVIDEPGLQLPILKFGPKALFVRFFGKVHELDTTLDQRYLRSRPVNSEEGTPMGIGVWYEMRVSDPVAYLFENTDPVGSLEANVTNATVRCLSNLPLDNMLTDRHAMSRAVRSEVSPQSESWGYRLGSVYIRKVHFRDLNMIHQIEQKVVNRLRQVTSAIRQEGTNRVDIITSAAEKEAAVEFARARAVKPEIIGRALNEIGLDPEVLEALFLVLETQKINESGADITLIPKSDSGIMAQLLATHEKTEKPDPEPRRRR